MRTESIHSKSYFECLLWLFFALFMQVMVKLQKMQHQFELHIQYQQPVGFITLKWKLSVREEMGKFKFWWNTVWFAIASFCLFWLMMSMMYLIYLIMVPNALFPPRESECGKQSWEWNKYTWPTNSNSLFPQVEKLPTRLQFLLSIETNP